MRDNEAPILLAVSVVGVIQTMVVLAYFVKHSQNSKCVCGDRNQIPFMLMVAILIVTCCYGMLNPFTTTVIRGRYPSSVGCVVTWSVLNMLWGTSRVLVYSFFILRLPLVFSGTLLRVSPTKVKLLFLYVVVQTTIILGLGFATLLPDNFVDVPSKPTGRYMYCNIVNAPLAGIFYTTLVFLIWLSDTVFVVIGTRMFLVRVSAILKTLEQQDKDDGNAHKLVEMKQVGLRNLVGFFLTIMSSIVLLFANIFLDATGGGSLFAFVDLCVNSWFVFMTMSVGGNVYTCLCMPCDRCLEGCASKCCSSKMEDF